MGLAALGVALSASPTQAGWLFTNFSLGGPQGAGGTTINGINNNGSVVGFGQDSTLSIFTNFAGPPGVPTLLNVNNSTTAMANGINSSNEVVGGVNGNAFTLTNNFTTFNTLTPFNSTTTSETAAGVNDKGVIVGQYSDSATGLTPGFVYDHGTYTSLSPVSPVGGVLVVNAQGVNNNGLVTGFYSTDNTTTPVDGNEPQHGFFYDTKTKTYTLAPDPTKPNFFTVQLLGINDSNMAVGYWQDALGDQHGLLYNFATAELLLRGRPQCRDNQRHPDHADHRDHEFGRDHRVLHQSRRLGGRLRRDAIRARARRSGAFRHRSDGGPGIREPTPKEKCCLNSKSSL